MFQIVSHLALFYNLSLSSYTLVHWLCFTSNLSHFLIPELSCYSQLEPLLMPQVSFQLFSLGELCMHDAQSLNHAWLSCSPMDCSLAVLHGTLLHVHGILQARIPGWVAISSSRGSSRHRDWTCVSCVSCIGRLFPGRLWPAGKDCLPLLLFRNHLWLRVNFLYLYLYALKALRKRFVVITFLCFFVHRILKGGILLVSPPLNMVPWTWFLLNKYLLKKMHWFKILMVLTTRQGGKKLS